MIEDKRQRIKKRGITLIELMIALGLATLVAGTVVGIMATGSRLWKSSVSKFKTVEQESALLERIAKELEEATKIYSAEGTRIAFYRQGYTVNATPTPHGCTGVNLNHPNCANPNAVPWDPDYAGGPYWKGLKDDIVWYYTKVVGGRTVIVRKVTDGFTPTIERVPETIVSDQSMDISRLRFTYWNFMGYFPYENLGYTPIAPPGATDLTPNVRVIPARIMPSDYPHNRWQEISWAESEPPSTTLDMYSRVLEDANLSVWWDDTLPAGANPAPNWAVLPTINPYSGERAIVVDASAGIATYQFTGAGAPAIGTPSHNLLYYGIATAGPFALSKQPTADTDTSSGCQLDVTLGAQKKEISGKIEQTEGTGYITIAGTDPNNATISETLEFFGCGFTLTTQKTFKTVTGITTTGLHDERFSDNTSSAPYITITNPNKKVYLFSHVYIDPYPINRLRILVLRFFTGTEWRYAYWASQTDKVADNDGDKIIDIDELTSTLSADGRDRMYMGPLPPVGGWVVLGVPVSYPGIRLETAGGGVSLAGQGISIFNGKVFLDKTLLGAWSSWGSAYATPGGSSISKPSANYIQFRGSFATTAPTSTPILSETNIKHGGSGGLSWMRTSDEDWLQGTFSNTIVSAGDVKLWRLSGPDNLVQGEQGPFDISLSGYSYYGGYAPAAGVWQKIRWTRSGESGWAPNFTTWNYRRRITLQETKGLVRTRDVIIVDIPPTNVKPDGSDIRITTLNGTEKPFKYLGKVNGTDHRVMFLGNCPGGSPAGPGTFTYFVYYGNAAASMPSYTKASTPAWPSGTGIVGNYFSYNVRYRNNNFYPLFPTNTGPDPDGTSQGSYQGQRFDNNVNFNWGGGTPGMGSCGSDYFSVSWRGFMYLDATTNWTFRINKDSDTQGVARVYVGDMTNPRVNINTTTAGGLVTGNDSATQKDSSPIALDIGMHQLKIDYSEYSGSSNISISRSKGVWEVIPKVDLYGSWEQADGKNGYGTVGYTIGPQQTQGTIDYPDKIVLETRSSEDGSSWSAWQPAPPYGDTPSYPFDGGATTDLYTISNTEGARRFLQFRATLTTTDTTVSPIVAEVKVYNVALDPDGNPATGQDGWITQTTQDDWEAGLVGTATDAGMPANLQRVPSTNVRKYPGSVSLASQVGNVMNATEERTANVQFKKDTTHPHIWDQLYWVLGTPEWPQGLYKYRVKIVLEELDGVPRFREPAIITINQANIQNGGPGQSPAGGDIRVVNGKGEFVPYQLVRASPPNFTIMLLVTLPPKGTVSYWVYYYKIDPATGNRVQDTGVTYTKEGQTKWAPGNGMIGNYWSYTPSQGDNITTIRNKQFWGTYQGQRRETGGINFNWGRSAPAVGSCGSDYFSVGWRGYVYLNPSLAGNWQFRIKREDNDLGLMPPSAPIDSKQNGYMGIYIGHSFSATAPTNNSLNYSGIDLGAVYTDRYMWANTGQGVQQGDMTSGTTTDSSTYTYSASARNMLFLTVNYAEYAQNARAQVYWTPPGQGEQIIPASELYGFHSRIKGGTSDGARPISLKSQGPEETKTFSITPGTVVQLQSRISEDGSTYDTYYSYSTTVDAEGFGVQNIPQAQGNKRYIQVRVNLSTSDITKTPILSEVGLFNRATGSYYRMTEQADFEAYDTLDNVDSTSSGGNLLLAAGTGDNLADNEGIFNPNYNKSTYCANIWTKIRWIRASARWPYPEYLHRRKITFSETAGIMRVQEPVVFSINDANIQADGKDIRITDTNGSKRPYQLIKNTNPFHILMLVNCAPNSSVSYYLYYYKLNTAGEITSGRATDTGETYNKTTSSLRWPAGTGIVGSYYTNNTNRTPPTINYQSYRGQWKSPNINFNWGTGGPVASNYFSAVWNGFVYCSGSPSTTYKFRAKYNQGAILRVGNPSPMNLNSNPSNTPISDVRANNDDADGDTTSVGFVLSPGFNKIQLEYDEYSGNASVRVSGVISGGNSQDPPPDPATTPIPQSELYGYYGNGAEFKNNGYAYLSGPLSGGLHNPTIGAVETQGAEWNLDGNIAVYTQGSDNGTSWTPASPGAGPWAGGTGAETTITAPNDRYRFIRFRADLSTSDTTKTPVLAEVQLWNEPAGKWYTLTEQDEWKASPTLSNVDADALPGSVTLPAGTGNNISVGTDTNNLSVSMNTYAATIWDTITWWIGYNQWRGNQRQWRRLLTIREPNIRDREYEPIDISGTLGAGRILSAGCGDLLLTTEAGTEVPYQLISCNTTSGDFTIRLPVLVGRNESVKYWLYYGAAGIPSYTYTKETPIRFPHGDGVVRRRWGNSGGSNWSTIDKQSYWGRDQRLQVQQGNDTDYFSARFDGWIYSKGSATLRVWSDDHQNVWVNGTNYGLQLWAGTRDYANALAAGFNRFTVEMGDYSGGAGLNIYGVDSLGIASITTEIPNDALYVCWTENQHPPGAVHEASSFRQGTVNGITTVTWGSEQIKKDWVEDPQGRLVMDVQGSVDGTSWSGWTNVADYTPARGSGQTNPPTDPPTALSLPLAVKGYRFLQWRVTLDTAGNTSYSPILSQVWVKNVPEDKMYETTTKDDFIANAGYLNVDWNRRPGDLMLAEASSSNNSVATETFSGTFVSEDTYRANVWTHIKWFIGFDDWPGGLRLYRRLITISEPGNTARTNEPVEVTVTVNSAADVCDNGNDILLTTQAGTPVAYQLTQSPGTGTTFKLLFPVTVSQNSNTRFYVYYGDSSCSYPPPSPPSTYTKSTSPRFPDGEGVVRRTWSNPNGWNNATINYHSYQGKTFVDNINYSTGNQYFTAKFEGWIYNSGAAGTQIQTNQDDHIKAYLNSASAGRECYNCAGAVANWGSLNPLLNNRITIETGNYTGGGSAVLNWTSGSVIPKSELYIRWTSATSNTGGGDDNTNLSVTIGAVENRSPDMAAYGRTQIDTYGSHDGITWAPAVTQVNSTPLANQPTFINLVAGSGSYRFLRFRAILDTAGNTSRSPILGGVWILHSDTKSYGADSQTGWKGTASSPEAGAITATSNIDTDSRAGDILLNTATSTALSFPEIGPIGIDIAKDTYAATVWSNINWTNCGFDYVRYRTASTLAGLASATWSGDINPDTPPTCSTTNANITGNNRYIQYNLRQTNPNRSTTINYVRLTNAEGTVDDTNFLGGSTPTGSWAERNPGGLYVRRWNATSDATGAGQSLDLTGHRYRRFYQFGTKNETREPVEFTVNADIGGRNTTQFTVVRYINDNDIRIVAHKMLRSSGTAYTLLVLLQADNEIFGVYYGGTRTSVNYTKVHWDNSYGSGIGAYGSCYHNRANFFSTARDCGGTDNNLRATINYSQSSCFICGGGCESNYFQDAWRGWVYTDTNTDLYVDTIDDNADCQTRNEAGSWSGFAANPGQAVTSQSWYQFEVRHRGYVGNDSVRFRGNVNAPMPQSHLYGVRYFDPQNYHPDTTMPSSQEGSSQDYNVGGGDYYSVGIPSSPFYVDYYIYPGWYGYPFSSDVRLYFNKAKLEDTDRIEIWDASTGALLTTYNSPRDAAIDTGYLGDTYGNQDRNYILVRYYFLRSHTSPSPGISIQNMTIRPCSADGGTSGANRPKLAIDGSTTTYWAGGTPPKTITIDSGSIRRMFRYRFRVFSNSWYRYKFFVSDDGSNWVQVSSSARETWSTAPDASLWYEETFPSRNARYARLQILSSSSGNSSIYEIELYATTYQVSGHHEKRLEQDFTVSNQYYTFKGRRVRLTFGSFNLRTGDGGRNDVLRIYNDESGVLMATYSAASPPPSPTPWFGYNTTDPSTQRTGVRLRFELTYAYSGQNPSGYSVTGYEIEKLAYEEDRSTEQITSHPPWRAIDNDTNTFWDGLNNGPGTGLIIDLGKMKNLFKYEWVTKNNAVYRYRVDVSTDRTNWTKVSDNYDANGQDPESLSWNTASGASLTYTDTFPQIDARYVRLTLLSGGNRVRELRIFPTTYQASGNLVKQLPPERIIDEKIVQLPARNARLYFASLNLQGNIAGTRDELRIIDNDTGTTLLTLNSGNNNNNFYSAWLNPSPRKHTSSGLTLRLQLHYMYSGTSPAGYNISSYEYEKLAFDRNNTTGAEDIHTAGREPFYAIDNDLTTFWQTTGTNNVSLVIDFGKLTKINKTQWYGVGGANYRYKIETSTDGSEWDLKSSEQRYLNNQTCPAAPNNYFEDSFPDTEARFARIVFVDTGVNATVYEFRCRQTLFITPGHVISNQFPLPARAWEFSVDGNLQNWTMINQLTNASVSGGIFRAQSTGVDPHMHSEDNLGINGDTAKYIIIRANLSAGTHGQVFFTTTDDTTWNETKSRRFAITAGSWRQYFIDMSDVPGWSGKIIKQLRIDPTDSATAAGGVQIDYIRVLEPQIDKKIYYIGARDANIHIEKLYLRGYDRLKIFNNRTGQLLKAYTNNIDLPAEFVDAGYNYPGGAYTAVTPSTSENMVDGAPAAGPDPTVSCSGPGFCTGWLSTIAGSGCPVEDGYGIELRFELIYDYQGENSAWDGYKLDTYKTRVLAWDNDAHSDAYWQYGSPPVNYVGGNRPSFAIDNNTATVWDGGSPIQQLIVDLGQPQSINKINIEYDGGGWRRYEIFLSLDGSDWGKRVSSDLRLSQTIPQPTGGYIDTFLPQEARYVLLKTTETEGGVNVRVKELRIHQAVYENPGYAISYKLPSLKTGQQLQNYGFELNTGYTTPTYWTKTSGNATSVEHIADVRPNNDSTKQSIRLNTPAADNVYLRSDPIVVNPTDMVNSKIYEYYLSGWIKTSGTTAAELGIEWYDNAGAQIKRDWITFGTSANGVWQYFEGVYMSPSNAASARVFLARWNQSVGNACYDDLRFSLADFQYDVKALRAAAGQIKPHFSRLQMVNTSPSISGEERLRDKLWIQNDSTGAIIDVDAGTPGNQVRTAADGGLINNPMDSAYNTSSTWLSYLGTADVRFVLRYNYTGLADKGYTVNQYRYRPVAYACDGSYSSSGSNPDRVIDGDVTNANFWTPSDGAAGHEHWIEVNLGKVASLRKISVVHQWSPSVTYKYKVELSADAETWTDIRSPGMSVDPSTPDTWTTGVASGTYGSSGFVQTFTRFDAQYVRVTYTTDHATVNKPRIVELKIWETPFITPGSLTSELLAPRRRADGAADGAIVMGRWNQSSNTDDDWSFNNYGWAGAWVSASGNYQTVNSDGTLNAAGVNLNSGVWDGRLNLYYPAGNSFIHSPDKTGTGGLFDAGTPLLSTDYTVARHLQANFQISGAATNAAWAFMTRDGYNGAWTWKYTSSRPVSTTGEFISLTWDMLDGSAHAGVNWPWITVVANQAINNANQTLSGAQPPYDINLANGDSTPTLRVDVSGATVWGSVKITGVDATGASIEETLRFRENSTMSTRRKFARVDSVQTSRFTGGNITVRCLSFAGTIGRLAFRAHDGGARYVFIDSLRALPKVSYQKIYTILEGTTIPSAGNPNNPSNNPTWAGAGFVNLHINKFRLYADDLLQIWGKDASGNYTVLLRNYDKNSFPSTDTNAGWTGNLSWGYDSFKIILIHTPTGDSVNCNPAVTIDKFVRGHNFYVSSVYNNDKPNYGGWRAADQDTATFWKADVPNPSASPPLPKPWPVGLANYSGWYVDLSQLYDINRAVVKWKSDVVEPGEFQIMVSSDEANWTPANIVAQGGQTYIFAATNSRYVGVMHPKDGANSNRQDVRIELAEFEIYPAGDYVIAGNYYSQPYCGINNGEWIIPYPKDSYDMRIHFTKFQTQEDTQSGGGHPSPGTYSDILRIYTTGMPGKNCAGANIPEGTLLARFYGDATSVPGGWLISQAGATCNDGHMQKSYNPCIPDPTGYRTPWLISQSTGAIPSCIRTENIGMRWKLMFTAPLGYLQKQGWEIDRYELYSMIRPALIQIDIFAKSGTGKDQKTSSITTKVQPPNLIFR